MSNYVQVDGHFFCSKHKTCHAGNEEDFSEEHFKFLLPVFVQPPELPQPIDCENCGTTFYACSSGIRRGRKACCGSCFLSDTHGMREAGIL